MPTPQSIKDIPTKALPRIAEFFAKYKSANPEDQQKVNRWEELSYKKSQAKLPAKFRGEKLTKAEEKELEALIPEVRPLVMETVNPATDKKVGVDINGTPIQVSEAGTYYTVENGRIRTGPAFSPETPAPVRDISKPEQMTPAEWFNENPIEEGAPSEAPMRHFRILESASDKQLPLNAEAVEVYREQLGLDIPEGYVKQGDLYVYQPQTPQTNAPTKRNQQEGNLEQYPSGDAARKTPEAGSGNRAVICGLTGDNTTFGDKERAALWIKKNH